MSAVSPNPQEASEKIKNYALHTMGIDLVGICLAKPLQEARQHLQEFLQQGFHGEMKYLENADQRTDPQLLLSGAQSVIVIAVNYYREKPATPPDYGRVARYAWGRDYHKVLRSALKQLQAYLDQNWPDHQHKICIDSAPILEKAYAQMAGLGFYGKNTTLINPQIGSFTLLGEIITSLPLSPDQPISPPPTCGTCTRCLDACPTKALIAPGKMDARRCISYLTIESKEAIPEEFASASANLINGCDICQEVCPYNLAFAKPLSFAPMKQIEIAGDSIPLQEILKIRNTEEYLRRFAGSPLMRPKRQGLIKNAINAALNAISLDPFQYLPKFLPLFVQIAEHDQDPLLRRIATEARAKLLGS